MSPTARPRRPRAGRRVALVAGLRTPFARQSTAFRTTSTLELGMMVVNELLVRTAIEPSAIDLLVFGQVLPVMEAPNIAREIVLGTGMAPSTVAYSVSQACTSAMLAMVNVAQAIETGAAEVGIAGGTDSASVVPITLSRRLATALVDLTRARSARDRVKILAGLKPRDLSPVPPAVTEYSTGMTMGEHGEQLARDHGISRSDQDAFALRSHTLAARAWEQGKLDGEVMRAYVPPFDAPFVRDNVVRPDTTLEALARLRPAFDRRHGTLTAGNSTALTDGASAVVLMREDRARALGLEPLGFLRSHAFAALDTRRDMLMGPAHAIPIALDRARVRLSDIDLVDMHEAFAAQVLANLQALESTSFAREKLNRTAPVGSVAMDRFNVLGGSIAYGHPFAATGGRIVTQTLRELRRRGGGLALTSACAAGGLAAAMVWEVTS